MMQRGLTLGLAGLLGGALALASACGSSSGGSPPADDAAPGDATMDQATIDHTAPIDQAADASFDAGDSSLAPIDSALSETGATDARAAEAGLEDAPVDAHSSDAGADAQAPVEAGPPARCSPVDGPACDIVSQNCPAQNECVLASTTDGGFTTACSQDLASEHLAVGHTCCPSQTNPCAPGLECIGSPCDADAAAPPSGRCAAHCCLGPDGGDDTPCGTSPEGYAGHCDLDITDGDGGTLYAVCSYEPGCLPLHVRACPAGLACEVVDTTGTGSCAVSAAPDGGAGLGEGQPCSFANECADGLECLAIGGASFTCTWLCYVPGQATPFDAGALTNQPGQGGCPAAESCLQAPHILAPWLGTCSP